MEGISLLKAELAELKNGARLVECVVLETGGSVARYAGARMYMREDGSFEGTIGGGAPELTCQRLAPEVFAENAVPHLRLDRNMLDSVCGGWQDVALRVASEKDVPALEAMVACLDAGGQGWLNTDWEDAAAPIEFESVDSAVCLKGMAPSYEGGILHEPLVAPDRAIILGGGHVGRALCPVLASIDFEVIVYDDREEVATPEIFPTASQIIYAPFDNIAEHLEIRPSDYVMIMTHGHVADETCVAQAMCAHPYYLGCIGSRSKRKHLIDVVSAQGHDRAAVEAIDLPIGLSIGAVTPAEIAISVAAKIIEARRKGEATARTTS